MHEDCDIQIRHLENLVGDQARTIDKLRARGPLGFFQRRRIRRENSAAAMSARVKEDELRNQAITLKAKIRELEEQLGNPR